ncbi:MAG: hypothetical protein JJE08_02510 [Proteiniphilum sp.]|nr:hypothetical protein [Proteiniphilum sp.]
MGESSFIQRITKNPAFGLIPMLVFSILVSYTDGRVATGIALLLSLLGYIAVKRLSRLIYKLSLITFAVALPLSLIFFTSLPLINRFVIVEIIFVLMLITARLSRNRIVVRMNKKKNLLMKSFIKESFRVAFQTQYALSFHLLLVLGIFLFGGTESATANSFLLLLVTQIMLVVIMLMESGRLYILDKKLHKEEWLPVVTESGDVTGRVAKSITRDMKNKFMHPVVRVALIYKGKIYLKERDPSRLLNPGMLDYPFEKYMQYNHEIDVSVHNSIVSECGNKHIPLRFLLKYTFENETTKRLIFLYVSDIDNEELFNSLLLKGGKLWTESQIEDNMGHNLFSECFELEFEYLKNTVLLAHQFREKLKNAE